MNPLTSGQPPNALKHADVALRVTRLQSHRPESIRTSVARQPMQSPDALPYFCAITNPAHPFRDPGAP